MSCVRRIRELHSLGYPAEAEAARRAAQRRADPVSALLLQGDARAAEQLEQAYALEHDWAAIIKVMRLGGHDWPVPEELSMPLPLSATLSVVSESSSGDFVGLLEYPVQIRTTVKNAPPDAQLAVIAVFPDRSHQLMAFPDNYVVGEPATMRLLLQTRQPVWTARCPVHIWVVRKFDSSRLFGFDPEPSDAAGLLAISSPSVIFLRPVVRR